MCFVSRVYAESSEFDRLQGEWLRMDGGYTLKIQNVDIDGKAEAAYFNPHPIHVSQAEAKNDAGIVKVFIKLRDRGYPGSTYDFVYDPGRDELRGLYFQATIGKNFDVVFVRVKNEGKKPENWMKT